MNAAEPRFAAVAGTDLYWLDGAAGTAGLLASPGAGLGPAPSLTQTWADPGGVYVFLGLAPADATAFAADLRTYLKALGWPSGPRFLWLADPTLPPAAWSGQTLDLRSSGGAAPVSTVLRRADFALANYTLSVAPGSTVAPSGGTPEWGFMLAGGAPAPATLFAPGGAFPCTGGTALLSFARAGCWRFTTALPAPAGGTSGLDAIGAGLRYFATGADGYVGAIPLAALRQPAAAVPLDATVDPLRPLVPARTGFSFFPAGGGTPPVFGSGYATARGYFVDLTPLPAAGALPDAGLAFAFHPLADGAPGTVPGQYYLVPAGAFAATVRAPAGVAPRAAPGDVQRLLCGDSGLEYLGLPATGATLQFVPGCAAFAPALDPLAVDAPALTTLGTTAWCYVGAPAPVQYFAQPQDAPMYARAGTAAADDDTAFLDFLELPAATLPPADGTRAFPLAPYRDLDPALVRFALELEGRAIAPARRAAILTATSAAWSAETAGDGTAPTVGVTPQGLAAGISADRLSWTWLGIANTAGGAEPDLRFTRVGGRFRQAMQTNRLFLVLGDPDALMADADVAYQLTPLAFGVIATLPAGQGVSPAVLSAVRTAFAAAGYPVYGTEAAFDAALAAAAPGITAAETLVFQREAGLLTPTIDGWRFQLSPRNWLNPARAAHQNAYLIFKFALGASLATLAADTTRWTWPEAASPGGAQVAQTEILGIVAAAVEADAQARAAGVRSPYRTFVQNVTDPNWTGILALSADVPLDTLPAPLQMLAAGIDPNAFYAHHVGFNVTPFSATASALQFGRTSTFGLIDYRNDEDQYFTTDVAYAFRVMRLTAEFANSAVSGFSSSVELLVNRLFGAPPVLYPTQRGNNVLLDGVYQKQRQPDGTEQETYVFSLAETGTFLYQDDMALRSVDVLAMQLVTTKPAVLAGGDATVEASFVIAGNLRFFEPERFDPFSFGQPRAVTDGGLVTTPAPAPGAADDSRLRFDGLAIGMRFALGDPAGTTTFAVNEGAVAFDLANSVPRARSLVRLFPVTLSGFVASSAQDAAKLPDALGFVSVSAPLEQSRLQAPWYGLLYTVDLGDLGALAARADLSLRVLAAWSAGGTAASPAVYLGVRLPGVADAVGVSLPLQGVLDLGFRAVQFRTQDDPVSGAREYALRFRDFALRFFGMAFPPGNNDVYLFGNPDPTSNTKLGWYAAYAQSAAKKTGANSPPRAALRATRASQARSAAPRDGRA